MNKSMDMDKVLLDLLDITISREDNWRQFCCQYPDDFLKKPASSELTPVSLSSISLKWSKDYFSERSIICLLFWISCSLSGLNKIKLLHFFDRR